MWVIVIAQASLLTLHTNWFEFCENASGEQVAMAAARGEKGNYIGTLCLNKCKYMNKGITKYLGIKLIK